MDKIKFYHPSWSPPVKQPLRCFDEEKRRAIGEEIHKLMAAGYVLDIHVKNRF